MGYFKISLLRFSRNFQYLGISKPLVNRLISVGPLKGVFILSTHSYGCWDHLVWKFIQDFGLVIFEGSCFVARLSGMLGLERWI